MTDCELLELAAKAAGWEYHPPGHIDTTLPDLDGWIDPSTGDVHWRDLWHPLTDDGDALRLAVKLRMHVDHRKHDGVWVWIMGPSIIHIREDGADAATTRRAIVRAAAAMVKP